MALATHWLIAMGREACKFPYVVDATVHSEILLRIMSFRVFCEMLYRGLTSQYGEEFYQNVLFKYSMVYFVRE